MSSEPKFVHVAMSESGHSRRFGFVRFRRHCGHEFLRRDRDGPLPDSCDATNPLEECASVVVAYRGLTERICRCVLKVLDCRFSTD